jgi:hypothetical protein
MVTSLRVRDATPLCVIDGRHHPLQGDVGGRIAVARFAQNGGLHTL